MSDVTLIQIKRVVEYVGNVFGSIEFAQKFDDTDEFANSLRLSAEDWEALGSPEALTVTIEPGDRLNG